MAEEGFLRRWARRKTEVRDGRALAPEPAPAQASLHSPGPPAAAVQAPAPVPGAPQPAAPAGAAAAAAPAPASASASASTRPLPTMEDVAALDMNADFSAFVARGVDQAVRRSALKKLFADPHFNVMDRLDVYIDDFTKPSPVSEEMLASLTHAKSVFRKMLEDAPEPQPELQPQPEPPQPQPEQAQAEPQQPPEQETQ